MVKLIREKVGLGIPVIFQRAFHIRRRRRDGSAVEAMDLRRVVLDDTEVESSKEIDGLRAQVIRESAASGHPHRAVLAAAIP